METQRAVEECSLVLLSDWPVWAVALAALAAALALFFSWMGYRRTTSWRRRLLLFSCRTCATAIALVIFLQPGQECRNVTRRPTTIVLALDTSRSMSVADGAPGKDGARPTRLERARRALERLLDSLGPRRDDHRIEVFAFDDTARPSSAADVASAIADGDSTRTQESLESVLSRRAADDLAGVVILSDGADNGVLGSAAARAPDAARGKPPQPTAVAANRATPTAPSRATDAPAAPPAERDPWAFFRKLGAPVHAVIVGEREGLRDVAIASLRADPLVFVHNAFEIDVDVSVRGYEGLRLPVTLRRDDAVLTTQTLRTKRGESHYRLTFKVQPERIGKFLFTVSIPQQTGEATFENNVRDFAIKVVRDKIRVLHVVGRPSWDERFLRRLLKRNPNVDLISFFILRTPTDLTLVPPTELSLIPFPTRELFTESLSTFDLVIFQNFDFRPYEMRQYLAHVGRYVSEHGGAFVMVGGDISFASGGYAGTEIADILPVAVPAADEKGVLDTKRFRPLLTGEGKRHPIFRLAAGDAANEAAFAALPELEGTNVVLGLRPGASALALHPRLRAAMGGGPMPVVATMDVGRGRSLAITTDTTWHWAFAPAENTKAAARLPYQTFWTNAIRWLIRDPELELVRIVPERERFTPRENAIVEVRVQGRDYVPAQGAQVVLEIAKARADPTAGAGRSNEPPPKGRIERRGTTGEGGGWRVDLGKLAAGPYRLTARATLRGDDLGEAREALLSSAPPRELEDTRARPALLERLAARTGGVTWRDNEAPPARLALRPPRVVRIDSKHAMGYWDHAWVLAAAILFLGAEWWLRRRFGMM
jgi:uncharacterized membrane protein